MYVFFHFRRRLSIVDRIVGPLVVGRVVSRTTFGNTIWDRQCVDKVARDDESRDVGAVWRRVATTVAVFVEQCPRGITRNKKKRDRRVTRRV